MGQLNTLVLKRVPWAMVILLVLAQQTQCLRVQFFDQPNYSKLLKEVSRHGDTEKECIEIPPNAPSSLKTDSCIIDYQSKDCDAVAGSQGGNLERLRTWDFGSQRFDHDEPEISKISVEDTEGRLISIKQYVQSLHICSRSLGGGREVDVDFYPKPYYQGNIVSEFRDACGCQNLDWSTVGGKSKQISVNNHGNAIELYEGEQCTGQSKTLAAGDNVDSRKLWRSEDSGNFDIQSFRPLSDASCYKLEATIYEFHFKKGAKDLMDKIETENIKLKVDADVRNNGADKIIHKHSLTTKITNLVEVVDTTGFSNMHTVAVKASFKQEIQGGIPLIASGKGELTKELSYQFQRTDSGSTSNTTAVTTEESVVLERTVEILPCKAFNMISYVKMIKNFPIQYTAYATVTGTAGGNQMTAAEIKSQLDSGVTYVKDVDENTVDVAIDGLMKADFGYKTFLDVNCKVIPRCVDASSSSDGKSHFILPGENIWNDEENVFNDEENLGNEEEHFGTDEENLGNEEEHFGNDEENVGNEEEPTRNDEENVENEEKINWNDEEGTRNKEGHIFN